MPTYPETPLYRAITTGQFPIIVSLPRHDLDLARAALDGGATAIKVHLNAHHRASGTSFGSFTEERPFLEAVAKLGAPLLVMAGQETVPTPAEMDALADLGFEGFNVYIDHLQPHLLQSRLRPMPALSATSTNADIDRMAAIPGAMIEASIMEFSGYGQPMTEDDLGPLCPHRPARRRADHCAQSEEIHAGRHDEASLRRHCRAAARRYRHRFHGAKCRDIGPRHRRSLAAVLRRRALILASRPERSAEQGQVGGP